MNHRLASYWTGKVVLLTGASSGLGWAVVEALAPYRIQFGLLSRRVQPMQALAEKLRDSGSTFWIRACDVRRRDEVFAAVRAFHREAGHLDVAWVNSGVGGATLFHSWDWVKMEAMIDTNLRGAIYTTLACLEVMVPQGSGTIVGIGSVASMRGVPGRSIYSLTKAGVAFFLESLAVELPEIQFTIIHPGFVDTPLNQGNPNRLWLLTPEQAAQRMIKAVARGRQVFIYPFRMNLLYRVVRVLPSSTYRWLARKALGLRQARALQSPSGD